MTFCDPDLDIRHIYTLLKLSEKLAITPPLDGSKERIKHHKYYSLAVMMVIIIGTVFSLYGIAVHYFPLSKSTSAILSVICIIATALLSIISVIVAVLNAETWTTFFNFFKYIDLKLNKGNVTLEQRNWLKMELLLYHFIMFCIFGYDFYVLYSNHGWKLIKYGLFRYIMYYHCVIAILVVLNFASALRGRFRRINNILIKTNDLHNIINSLIARYAPERVNNLKSIKEVTEYYLMLSELVDMFNKLLGWQIFFMTENLILLLLEVLNSFMLSIDYTTNANHEFRTILFWAALSLILIIFHSRVVLYCEDVNNESRNTLTICYKLQQTVDPISDERKELIILSDLVNLLKTRTSAAGFYFINRSLISRVFAHIFSYSIVLIQFNKQ